MKLIIFGGSFDPPHLGHLKIIEKCCGECDKIILMPSAHSPLKKNPPFAESKHRLKLMEILIQELNHPIQIDDWEINQTGPNYTYLTIQHIQNENPNSSISLVVGADQLEQFNKWKNYKEILKAVHIIGFNRVNYHVPALEGINLTWIKDFKMDISSTEIRLQIAKGDPICSELPQPVWNYIQDNNLYGYE
ncbi:MAG: nicotinate (nicotinamide) nucleotide adenylyltransferase [Candidatus Marinimicrobia bacterium]|nr:nicotinate (nicotinamide) nucleotide adenylyltransferase [Candidatus Neomarinimicrobiota bacterium]